MKIFISWSGELSREVAKVLREWIPFVIQNIDPYVSAEDIDKGTRWSPGIASELEASNFGILCVTKENLNSQWLNFEAGALSKAMDESSVCPLLFNLQPSDVLKSPLTQFQMTVIERDDIFKLFQSMNSRLGDNKLDENRLTKAFDSSWDKIYEALQAIDTSIEEISISNEETSISNEEFDKQKQEKILEEMLDLLRNQERIINSPEKILPRSYFNSLNRDPVDSLKYRARFTEFVSNMEDLNTKLEHLNLMINNCKSSSGIDESVHSRILSFRSDYNQVFWKLKDFLMNERFI